MVENDYFYIVEYDVFFTILSVLELDLIYKQMKKSARYAPTPKF